MNKYFGIDLGSKTIGIAISNSGIIASNYKTIRFTENNYDQAASLLAQEIKDLFINIVVIGLPKHMNNDLGIRGQISIDFKDELLKLVNCEVVLWDERLSTKSAIKTLADNKKKKEKQRNLKDEVAAQFILQNYLDYLKGQGK